MADRHRQAEIEADRQRQTGAAERDQIKRHTEDAIKRVEQLYRACQAQRSRDWDRGFDIG